MTTSTNHNPVVTRLKRHVAILSQEIGYRDRANLNGLSSAARHIERELKAAGAAVSVQPFDIDGGSYENIIGSYGPASDERVVIGAHYDAVSGSPGADDNASGVAGLLELAGRLEGVALGCRVELAAYSLEESAFATQDMGSIRHAESLVRERARVRGMISLEMIGFYSDNNGSQGAPDPRIAERYPRQGNFLMVVGRPDDAELTERVAERMRSATTLPIFSINAPRAVAGIDLSDHRNFWDAGYPAVMITDTAFYRNPHYHMPTDTIETLDFNRMAMAVDGITAAVLNLAD